MFERSLTLHSTEYVQHINRLYNAVEHLLGWLKRISLAKQDPPGQWIPDLLDDLERLNTTKDVEYDAIQQPYIRLLIQDEHLKLKAGFAFESSRQTTDSTIVPRHNIVIGFYFPPEDYPMIDGEYPLILIDLNDLPIAKIRLDGTRRLYKPFFNTFWLHKNLLPVHQLHVYTNGRPYHVVQVFDSVDLHPTYQAYNEKGELGTLNNRLEIYNRNNHRMIYQAGSCGFRFKEYEGSTLDVEAKTAFDAEASIEYIKRCNESNVLSYAYLRAGIIIKRAWIKYRLQKKRRLIGAEIRILPDIGIDVIAIAERHQQLGIVNHPDRKLVDPARTRGNYDDRHNLELRIAYAEEAMEILLSINRSESLHLELKDCHLSLKRLRQLQK